MTHPWISFLALNIWLSGLSYFLCYHIPRTLLRDLQSPPLLERVDQSESILNKYSWFPDSNVWASLCRSAASHLDFSERQTTFSYEWKVKKSVELKLGSILHWDRRKQKRQEKGDSHWRHDNDHNTRESKQPSLRKERFHGIWATESTNVAFIYVSRTLFNALFTFSRSSTARQLVQSCSVFPQISGLSICQLSR